MKTRAILSALGNDRVGIADDLAEALNHLKIEIEDSRMVTLKGHFAVMLEVSGDRDEIASLRRDLAAIGTRLGSNLQLEPLEKADSPKQSSEYLIETYCPGPSGLGAVTAILKRNNINIEDLQTQASAAPWTSKLAFHMTARVTVPSQKSAEKLTTELRALERSRNLDIVIKPGAALVGS